MAPSPNALLSVLALAAMVLSGCTDGGTPDTADAGNTTTSTGDGMMAPGLTKDSVVDAPVWSVGDYFGHHLFFGGDGDSTGTHIQTMVVEDQGGSWFLATDTELAAKWEAAWDFPMLGSFSKKDLSSTAFGSEWNIYQFPMRDGMTWTASFNPLFEGERDLTMTATFADRIETPQGFKQGFLIEGRNEAGELELKTDYIPDIRWYSDLIYYEMFTEDPDDFVIHVRAMGQGQDMETPYLIASAQEKVSVNTYFAPANSDGSVNAGGANPPVSEAVTISEDADELYGLVFLLSVAGESQADLTDPDASEYYQYQATSTAMDDAKQVFEFVELKDPVAGEWNFLWAGAGLVAVGYVQLWEIQYDTILW